MDDLISRSTLLEELSKGTIITDDLYGMGIMAGNDHAMKKIKETPAVDAVEVVRCKNCKHNGVLDVCPMCFEETVYHDEGDYPDGSECWDVYEQTVDRTVYNGFCNFGERRVEDAND